MKKGKISFLSISLAIMAALALLMSGLATSWGKVTIKRIHIAAEDGKTVSAVFYIPETATNQTPAPAVLNFHGRGNNAHSIEAYAIEQARRGYVGIAVDWDGGGQSEELSDAADYATAITDYVKDLPFIQGDNLSATGWSAGNKVLKSISELYPDEYQTIISIFAPMVGIINGECNANLMILKSSGDQYTHALTGSRADVEAIIADKFHTDVLVSGETLGDFTSRTAREYVYVDDSIHQDANINPDVVAYMLDFLNRSVPAPLPLPAGDQIWPWFNNLSLLGYVSIFVTLTAVASALLKTSYFAAICNPLPTNRGKKGARLLLNNLGTFLFSTVMFIPLSYIGINLFVNNGLFPSRTLNSFVVFLLISGLFSLLMILLEIRNRKKNGETIRLSDYAIAGENETAFPWLKVRRAFLLGVLISFMGFAWVHFTEHYLGVSYNFWNVFASASFIEITPYRFVKALPYAAILIVIMFLTTIMMNTSNRLPDSGNPSKDMVIAIIVNGLLASAPILFLMLVQYGGCMILNDGRTVFPQFNNLGGNTSTGGLDFASSFPIMMFVVNGIVTYFYRKTGNNWTGTFIAGIMASFLSVATCAMAL